MQSSIRAVVLNISCTLSVSLKKHRSLDHLPNRCCYVFCVEPEVCIFLTGLKVLLKQASLSILQKSPARFFSFYRYNANLCCPKTICLRLRHSTLQLWIIRRIELIYENLTSYVDLLPDDVYNPVIGIAIMYWALTVDLILLSAY